jgi:hypothetical protein
MPLMEDEIDLFDYLFEDSGDEDFEDSDDFEEYDLEWDDFDDDWDDDDWDIDEVVPEYSPEEDYFNEMDDDY